MPSYFMFGKYSLEALKGMSGDRTQKTREVAEKLGGKIISIHALLGGTDLLIHMELPGSNEALKASVSLSRLTGMAFSTQEGVAVEDFDRLLS